MRHSLYCSCHRCNEVPADQRVVQRQKHYTNGTAPPKSPAPRVTAGGSVSEQSLIDLRDHFANTH